MLKDLINPAFWETVRNGVLISRSRAEEDRKPLPLS